MTAGYVKAVLPWDAPGAAPPRRKRPPGAPEPFDLTFGSGSYRDRGCAIAPRCLECPLDVCLLDAPQSRPHVQTETVQVIERTRQACQLAVTEQLRLRELAARLGVAEVSARRLLRQAEARGIPPDMAEAARLAAGMRGQ